MENAKTTLQLSSVTFFVLRKTERDMIKIAHRSSSNEVPVIFVRF